MCILTPCNKQVTAEKIANLFFEKVWVYFGSLTSIVFDRDSRSVGKFWSSLWELMDTKLRRAQHSIHRQMVRQNWSIGQ